ncbi:hypothetical protein AMTRI_Chr01g126360 [Amborella trichopoda]
MKDLSLFLLKNSLAAKMKRGLRSFCNGSDSTSILNQNKTDDISCLVAPSLMGSCYEYSAAYGDSLAESPPTLEQMIARLDEEEAAAKAAKYQPNWNWRGFGEETCCGLRRMSCVNNSDILNSARNALNQYPRFSLDGRDSLYHSSFQKLPPNLAREVRWSPVAELPPRRSVCCTGKDRFRGGGFGRDDYGADMGGRRGLSSNLAARNASRFRGDFGRDNWGAEMERNRGLPPNLAAKDVAGWCKPGVVAKLMGLEVMPVPLARNSGGAKAHEGLYSNCAKRESFSRPRNTNLERRPVGVQAGKKGSGSGSRPGYCVMKPISVSEVRSKPSRHVGHKR